MQICKHDQSCLMSSIRGARNGIYYGAKIRFMHAVVMTFLFKTGTLKEKIANILKLTYEHSKNLGIYVFFYKYLVCLLNQFAQQNKKIHSFYSGAIVGYFVYRKKTAVNQQIVFYLLSRVLVGGFQNLQNKQIIKQFDIHPYLAAFSWGLVMFLFEDDKKCLQSSLKDSMEFLYKESDKNITHWKQLIPLDIDYFKSFFNF